MSRSRRARHTLSLAVSATLLCAAAPIPAPSAVVCPACPAGPAIDSGLKALHRGDYRRAFDEFKRAADAAPGAPEPLFYPVFGRWWQYLFAEGNATRPDGAFDQAFEQARAAATARLDAQAGDVGALAAIGGAEVLKAHVEAIRGNYWRSGQEARRGKKALEQALAKSPDDPTALFPMGALNYYADRVPLVVRGLRALFFIPGGDAALGLRQIRKVADGSGTLRIEGRLLFGLVCADKYQMAYDDALGHLDQALRESGGSALLRVAIGDLQIRLGRPAEAVATLRAGLTEAMPDGPEGARQRRWLRLGIVEALAGDWRQADAEQELTRSREESATLSEGLAKSEARIAGELAARRQALPFWNGDPADRRPGSPARAALDRAIESLPDAPIPRLLRARLALDEGDAALASALLGPEVAAITTDTPAWIDGSLELLYGRALGASGDARGARNHLERAAAVRRFRMAEQARLELGTKGEDAGICARGGA
ncbi:MAG TPA: tetratricopeptide repeat protein [Dongiaceae bacterium]|nr:tetratricopeptide repeat protein [Dongiaceae bacterium]